LSTSSQPASLLRWQAGRLEVASTTKLCRVAVLASEAGWQEDCNQSKIATNRRLLPKSKCYQQAKCQQVILYNKHNKFKLFL